MKGLNWGLCSSFSWTNDDNRHVLIAEEPCRFGISCQTTNFGDRYKNSIFSVFEFEINFEGFRASYNRTQEYFLWTVASKHPIRVNLVIRNCWTHEKEIQFLTICILSENNIFVPKSPSASISLQVHSVQWFTERFYHFNFEINPFYFFLGSIS